MFAAIAWPVRYGETGVMTFIVARRRRSYQRDLGPETAQRAAAIMTFNPDKDWTKADDDSSMRAGESHDQDRGSFP